jgi:hypothetical protein
MSHKSSIYSNPVIPAGFYNCKLLDLHLHIDLDASDTSDKPYLWSSLITGEYYGEYSGVTLASILYLTPNTEELVAKFKATFRISGAESEDDYLEALGRWGCVSVSPHEYEGTEFSCVSFVRQNSQMRATSISFEQRERMGEKAWLDAGMPL